MTTAARARPGAGPRTVVALPTLTRRSPGSAAVGTGPTSATGIARRVEPPVGRPRSVAGLAWAVVLLTWPVAAVVTRRPTAAPG